MEELAGTYRFRIADQLGPITVKIWSHLGDDGHLSAELSHGLKTPLLAGISTPQPSPRCDDPYRAAMWVAGLLDSEYQEAVAAGHEPNPSWLIPA